MKKFIVALALVGGVAAVAFASLHQNNSIKQTIEKKEAKKKNCCRMTCPFF
ncbi:MAG TPA: hypothetical protein VEB63_08975 [Chitinophagaceae bacterium]|nr:hypothetical protein [Chitinophagaceae bacterium]